MAKKENPKQNQKRRKNCKNCGSKFGYPRIKSGDWVCRTCGFIEKNKEEKE